MRHNCVPCLQSKGNAWRLPRRYDQHVPTLFTIGHSTHTLEHLTDLLKKHNVQAVCDVRSVPFSRHNPQFNRRPFSQELKRLGIYYGFLGKELGARSDDPNCYVDGKVQYNYLAEEPRFVKALQRVTNGINTYRVALLCAERDPLTCHRTILVCRELRSPDLSIEHILADGSIETNEAAEKRLMSILNIWPDMLNSERDCIERAYDKQANIIAYVKPSENPDVNFEFRNSTDEDFHDRLHE
jgi:uncharacterized protein (DUF488 family)